MIYLDEVTEQKEQFEILLASTRSAVLKQLSSESNPSTISGSDFELMVYKNAVVNASETPFADKLIHTADRDFPDIVAAGLFGIEVKATKKDDWRSIGNSVLESTRIDTVEKIYMFFGKLGGSPDIKFRNYEDCLKGISVTHYPRYQIDMLMDEASSIFKKMEIEYDEIRKSSNPVASIRAYYKRQMGEGDALWWIGDDVEDMPVLSPIIKNFSSLDKGIRDEIKARVFAFFPEILSNNTKKYEKIPAYLAAQYGVVTANLRDNFTAGGKVEVKYQDEPFKVPQIISETLRLSDTIWNILANQNEVQISNYWGKHIEGFVSAQDAWLKEVDRNVHHMGLPYSFSEMFQAKLVNEN